MACTLSAVQAGCTFICRTVCDRPSRRTDRLHIIIDARTKIFSSFWILGFWICLVGGVGLRSLIRPPPTSTYPRVRMIWFRYKSVVCSINWYCVVSRWWRVVSGDIILSCTRLIFGALHLNSSKQQSPKSMMGYVPHRSLFTYIRTAYSCLLLVSTRHKILWHHY